MSANVAPRGFGVFCRRVAEFSESLMPAKYEAMSGARRGNRVSGPDIQVLGRGLVMTRGLAIALALFALNTGIWTSSAWTSSAWAQGAPQCADFPRLSAETKKKADAVQAAINAKADRKQVCTLMTTFVASESTVIKFLEDNKVWCGVPDQAIAISKTNHEKSIKFKTMACTADIAPQVKPPSLSDAIKTPSVDSAKNTTTGRGTFDTLTGNPLAR
jgi:hypothetical protein